MDYSLLVGIHNVDQASRERLGVGETSRPVEGTVTPDQKRPQAQKALYSTAMESIQGEARGKGAMDSEDQWVTNFLTIAISISLSLVIFVCVYIYISPLVLFVFIISHCLLNLVSQDLTF